jgi:hypothetical protein
MWIKKKAAQGTMRKFCLLLTMLSLSLGVGIAKEPPPSAPFDLQWGMPLTEFTKQGIQIEEQWTVWGRAQAIRTTKFPNTPSNTGSIILVFDDRLGLAKIHWAGKPIVQDFLGDQGKLEFRQLKEQLSLQYGQPFESIEQTRFNSSFSYNEFYLCLQDEECARWSSLWVTPDSGTIILELMGFDRGAGFLHITYQGPNLENILRQAHQQQRPHQEI